MSQADIETIRVGYEAWSRGDWDAAFRSMHPGIEWKTPDPEPRPGTFRGREEFRRHLEDIFEPFEGVTFEPEEFFERDDLVAVIVRWCARPRGSTAVLEVRVGHLWTMRDGKASRCEIFLEREQTLEALDIASGVETG